LQPKIKKLDSIPENQISELKVSKIQISELKVSKRKLRETI